MKKLILPLIVSSILFGANLDNIVADLNNKNYLQAIEKLKKLKKNPQIYFLLGKSYFKRHLVYSDYKHAYEYFKKAKTPKSYYYIAKMYQKGLWVKKDINEAIRYYKLSNTKEAKYELAKLYIEGKDILKNPKIGLKLLKESAKEGYNKAQYMLGKLYLTNNDIVDKDLTKAAKWLYLAKNNNLNSKEINQIWEKYKLYKYL
jgi:TPR repeat protein